MLIGVGECRDGLYYFKGTPCVSAMKIDKEASLNLWHRRLGYLPMQVIKLVPIVGFKDISDHLNKCYDVCQRAKLRREKFSVSDFQALDVFELVHYDLWVLLDMFLLMDRPIF